MKTTAITTAILLASFAACGSKSASPATTPSSTPAAGPAADSGHVTIVPFKVTTIRTGPDGATSVNMVVTGDADGVIMLSKKGKDRPVARIDKNGEFHPVEGGTPPPGKMVIEKDGRLTLDGVDLAEDGGLQVTKEGSVIIKGKPALFLEAGDVVDVTGRLLRSTITINGNSKVSTFAITYEGGEQARQLVAIVLALQLAPQKMKSEPPRVREVQAP